MARNAQAICFYEVKLRAKGDRVDAKGNTVEGGKTFSRHFQANNWEGAKRRGQRYAKKFNTKVVSICKVHPDDVIGRTRDWDLQKLIGGIPVIVKRDVILENRTLDEIIFSRKLK